MKSLAAAIPLLLLGLLALAVRYGSPTDEVETAPNPAASSNSVAVHSDPVGWQPAGGSSRPSRQLPPATFSLHSRGQPGSLPLPANGAAFTPAEIASAFQEALGPGLLRALPERERRRIFENFRGRLTEPERPFRYLCWSPDTPPQVVQASHLAETTAGRIVAQAFQYIGSGRWSATATDGSTGSEGTPVTITWSIPLDGALNDDLIASDLRARLHALYPGGSTTGDVDDQPWYDLFVQAFKDLSDETGIIFVHEPNDDGANMSTFNDGIPGVRGDIRIFGANIDGNSGTLAYNYSPGYGDMVIDTADSYFSLKFNNSIRLRNVVSHEAGHGMGLGHVCPLDETKLMEAFASTDYVGAQFDDIYSLQRKYGDHKERGGGGLNNDSSTFAATIPLVADVTVEIPEWLSIDDNSDQDFFEITVADGDTLTITATPSSEVYLEGEYDDGCTGETTFDSTSYHNLGLQIRASNGLSVVASSDTQGDGEPETLVHTFAGGGTYYIRVDGDNTNGNQLYKLSALLQPNAPILQLNALDLTADEAAPGDTASVTITSDEPVPDTLTVTLTPSGTADPGDYGGSLTATILSGQTTSNTIVINAVSDSSLEGNETLTLTIPEYLSGPVAYAVGSPSSQDVTIIDAPAPEFSLASSALAAELFSEQNGVPDPGETVQYSLTLENTGTASATNVSAQLTGPAALVPFTSTQDYGTVAPGATPALPFTFALNGSCGEEVTLNLQVTGDGGIDISFPLSLTLGIPGGPGIEDVESGGAFPTGWTSSTSGSGTGWVVSNISPNSGSYAFFTSDPSSTGSSTLTSPAFVLPNPAGTLTFAHSYDTEPGYDGCVLEISIAGGAWQDIIAAGGTFTAQGYNDSLSSGSSNPLAGRSAWSGNSGGWINTSVTLPAAANGASVQFRWILGADFSIGDVGWRLDDFVFPGEPTCDTSGPLLTLALNDDSIREGDEGASLTISTSPSLPTASAIPITVLNNGSGQIPADVSGLEGLILEAGQFSTSSPLLALSDGLVEGPETLILFTPQSTNTVFLTLEDSPYGTWAASSLGTTGLVGPLEDFDGDGSLNIEEFAHDTLGADPLSRPTLTTVRTATHFKLLAPTAPVGMVIRGETSTDLLEWSTVGVEATGDGFQVPLGDLKRFLRLSYTLTE